MKRILVHTETIRTLTAFSIGYAAAPPIPQEPVISATSSLQNFGQVVVGLASAAADGFAIGLMIDQKAANAHVVFASAMRHGDYELVLGAVDSLRESVQRAILKNPKLAPCFYKLALLEGLSYDADTNLFGSDGCMVRRVLASEDTDEYTSNLQEAALALVEAKKELKNETAVSLADAVAIGAAEAIESVGGPIFTVHLGRVDACSYAARIPLPENVRVDLDIFSTNRTASEVAAAFRKAGLTKRDTTALLAGLLTLETVQKNRKTGLMSDFKWYIADSFGTHESRFGDRIRKDEKNFNKYFKPLAEGLKKKEKSNASEEFGWVALLLTDSDSPDVSQPWLNKYASSNLSYLKDLRFAFNSITQPSDPYTKGKTFKRADVDLRRMNQLEYELESSI
jgi:hypothetical protein